MRNKIENSIQWKLYVCDFIIEGVKTSFECVITVGKIFLAIFLAFIFSAIFSSLLISPPWGWVILILMALFTGFIYHWAQKTKKK